MVAVTFESAVRGPLPIMTKFLVDTDIVMDQIVLDLVELHQQRRRLKLIVQGGSTGVPDDIIFPFSGDWEEGVL